MFVKLSMTQGYVPSKVVIYYLISEINTSNMAVCKVQKSLIRRSPKLYANDWKFGLNIPFTTSISA